MHHVNKTPQMYMSSKMYLLGARRFQVSPASLSSLEAPVEKKVSW